MTNINFELIEPTQAKTINPEAHNPVWVYKFTDKNNGWLLSIATHGEPNSKKLSLGGFRIAPVDRAKRLGYNNDFEAIDLGIGMEQKIAWSRLVKAGGPLALPRLNQIVGGKCVLLPSDDARVGGPRDMQLLDFAAECFQQFENKSGLLFNTGQDLGHGILSDGKTYSLNYVHDRYKEAAVDDTSLPTAHGNYRLLLGMLAGLGIKPEQATIGFIGCGNIGGRVLEWISKDGAKTIAIEALPSKRESLSKLNNCHVLSPEQKNEFLQMPIDALVVNANGGSLDPATIEILCKNPQLKIINGSENLVMKDEVAGSLAFKKAGKIYCPTELGGMFGYLTAAEVYFQRYTSEKFTWEKMFEAAKRLEVVGQEVTSFVKSKNLSISFEEAVKEIYGAKKQAA